MTVALRARWAGSEACCQSQPPQRPGPAKGQGAGTRSGDASMISTASARRKLLVVSVTRARTRSPGSACRTNTTRPSWRATQKPPLATLPTSSSRRPGSVSESVTVRNTTATRTCLDRRARRPTGGPRTGRLLPALEPVRRVQLPRDASDHDAWLEQQPALQAQGALVVEELLPPVADDVLGDEHGDDVAGAPTADALDVGEDGPGDLPVRGIEDLQRDGDVERVPLVLKTLRLLRVHRDGHRLQGGRTGRASVGQRPQRRLV